MASPFFMAYGLLGFASLNPTYDWAEKRSPRATLFGNIQHACY